MMDGAALRSRRRAWVAALAVVLVMAPAAARAESEGAAYTGVVGIGAALCTLVYSPLKIAYAAGGSVVSGLAWLWTLGDTSVAGPIFRASVKGDYVVTPRHLDGRSSLHFVGPQ
jgi:hypothetical protein